jgi:hypothetical protein
MRDERAMSHNNRSRSGSKSKEQQALLDELDLLKALLNKEKDEEAEEIIVAAPWEFTPPAKPDNNASAAPKTSNPKESASVTPSPKHSPTKESPANKAQAEIPVLEEVVFPTGNHTAEVPELTEVVDVKGKNTPPLPDNKELRHLVEMLVERQLNKIKPVMTRQVITELERLYPKLKKR